MSVADGINNLCPDVRVVAEVATDGGCLMRLGQFVPLRVPFHRPTRRPRREAKTIIDSQNRKPLESLDGTYMGQSSKNGDVIEFNGA